MRGTAGRPRRRRSIQRSEGLGGAASTACALPPCCVRAGRQPAISGDRVQVAGRRTRTIAPVSGVLSTSLVPPELIEGCQNAATSEAEYPSCAWSPGGTPVGDAPQDRVARSQLGHFGETRFLHEGRNPMLVSQVSVVEEMRDDAVRPGEVERVEGSAVSQHPPRLAERLLLHIQREVVKHEG